MRTEKLLPSVVEAIGNTPLVELSRLTRDVDGRILAKLDHLNPGFSKKDRIAWQIIEGAEADGSLVLFPKFIIKALFPLARLIGTGQSYPRVYKKEEQGDESVRHELVSMPSRSLPLGKTNQPLVRYIHSMAEYRL